MRCFWLVRRMGVGCGVLGRRASVKCGLKACVHLGFFFFQAEDGIRDLTVTGVQTCALPILDALPIESWVSPKRAKWLDRYSALGLVAGLQALQDAGLAALPDGLRERAGVYLDRKSVV